MNTWDQYFLNIANAVASNSKCLSRQIGAVLVRSNIIISTGYSGPPRGVPSCSERYYKDPYIMNELRGKGFNVSICPRKTLGYKSGEGLNICPSIHGEKNCLLAAARNGVCTKDTILYLNAAITPCVQCLGAMINAGVKEVVVVEMNPYDKTFEWVYNNSKYKILIRKYDL
jgi:dCMP deaminase